MSNTPSSDSLAQDFVAFAVQSKVLRFGEFKTKAGRLSPYFFNAGLFDDGAKLGRLAEFYARRLITSGLQFDMLFGPAYKGIGLAATTAVELRWARPHVIHIGGDLVAPTTGNMLRNAAIGIFASQKDNKITDVSFPDGVPTNDTTPATSGVTRWLKAGKRVNAFCPRRT